MGFFDRAFRQPYLASTTDDYVVRLFSSWLLPPSLLFAWRLLLCIYSFAVLFFNLGWNCTHDDCDASRYSFSYFTVLTYWGIAFYNAFAAANTAAYAFRGRAWLQGWPAPLKWMYSVFYSSVTVFPFVVTAVFWGVLAKNALATEYSTWSNISEHALNSVYALIEIVLVRSDPHPSINILPLILILACYLGLAYLSHATYGFYVYSFLDPAHGHALVAGAIVGILVASIVVFFLVKGLIWVRRWLTERKMGLSGKMSPRSSSFASQRRDVEALELEQAYRK